MVENVLKKSGGPIKRSEIKKRLKTQIMHQTLNEILDYLEGRNLIIDSHKGIIWIYNPNKRLEKAVKQGLEIISAMQIQVPQAPRKNL